MSAEGWLITTMIAIVLAVTGGIIALVVTGNASCPKGQTDQFAYYMTMEIGSPPVPEMIPIYTCQPS